MNHLKMHSLNKIDENVSKIAQLFPNCVTEEKDENGEITHKIDFDMLKQELSTSIVEGREERYQFIWPDKKQAILTANAPINKTLRPCREESVNFDTTENLYIEGDNLEVLKLLQETYLGKIKMIYIDPPYNTGNDFVYEDDFAQNAGDYIANSGQYDEEGNRLVHNTESNGRFHTDWLNMMYPRLKLARDLLTDDGVIFISIDDNEVSNMMRICDEVFGQSNFISQLIWQKKQGGGNDSKYIAIEHEYILVYASNKSLLNEFYEKYSEDYIKRYKEKDEKGRYFWDTFKRKSGKQYYPITCPDGSILQYDEDGNEISWLRSKERFESDIKAGEIRIIKVGDNWSVQFKQRMPLGKTPRSIFTTETVISDKGTTSSGTSDVYEYFKKDVFSNPKPIELINFLLGFGVDKNDIVLDFFSGSATTAEAVMKNNIDGDNLKFILVQLQEDIDPMLNSSSANAKRIAENAVATLDELGKPHLLTELAKERIRRAGQQILKQIQNDKEKVTSDLFAKNNKLGMTNSGGGTASVPSSLDVGFRVLKVDSSNMQDVYYSPDDLHKQDLFQDNVKPDRTAEDLLFQVMLDLGVELSSKITTKEMNGKIIYYVNENYLVACFDQDITEEIITQIAKEKPYYFVMRDSGFANDSVATNFEQIFTTYSAGTIRKVL